MANESLYSELNKAKTGTFPEVFQRFRELSAEYGDMPVEQLISAFKFAGGFGEMYTPNPAIQNRRVKGIETRPANYSKDEVAEFLRHPDDSEYQLRAVEKGLEYTAYPMFHTRVTYQNLLTYHSYVAPSLTDKETAKRDDFWREWKLMEKVRKAVNPKDKCHEYCGLALQSGKVFVHPRVSVDKPRNRVNYAFLQQLPSDFVKIVGFNNVSKYTVAFNLMYFVQVGTDWRQFGSLFEPYINDFYGALTPAPSVRRDRKVVYARSTKLDLVKVRDAAAENVDAYRQNGKWYYWVTLPVDQVFPMEIDDTERNVIPPFAGLFIDLIQLAQYEAIQLSILQNPLVSILHGEIPYWDDRSSDNADQYKLSNAGRLLFQSLFYDMLRANNTGGIGFFPAPLENMKLETLSEAPGAMDIVSNGFTDVMAKAGLTALIPTTDDARAGAVQVSLMIESRFPQVIYTCFERMMVSIMENLNPRYEWQFHMFGDLSTDKDRMKELINEMTLGILPAAIEYNAMKDRSILDDIAWSDAVAESGLLDRRLPLVSTYSAKNETPLPPQGGRPPSEGITSDGQEQDIDMEQ